MIDTWIIGAVAVVYVLSLFGVAYWRDLTAGEAVGPRPTLYAFSLAVYCTSWTFYGSVGLAAHTGYDFIPVYLGPVLMMVFGWPLIVRIIRICKSQNIASIADFIAARYGKNQYLAALVTIIAVAGTVPYIALQLKAVSISVETLVGFNAQGPLVTPGIDPGFDIALWVALLMALFAVLFGTRHVDATEHQEGLMMAVAVESVVKLLAFLVVGLFVVYGLYGGFGNLMEIARQKPDVIKIFSQDIDGGRWLTIGFLSLTAFMLLPRQFHMMVVENRSIEEVRRAVWLFPLYLVAINLFVVPIAIAGLLEFSPSSQDADFFVLTLPQSSDYSLVTLIAFLGGLSAATAMVMVACVALAIMVCNDLVVPALIYFGLRRGEQRSDNINMSVLLLKIRRIAIIAILAMAYGFLKLFAGYQQLAAIGLLSFAAITQFAPAFFGGLVWRRGTTVGAFGGIVAGFVVWTYTLLLPWFVDAGFIDRSLLSEGPFGIAFLNPQALFYLQFDPLAHGVFWSILTNVLVYVGLSLWRSPQPIERLQANIFIEDQVVGAPGPVVRQWGTQITIDHLRQTVARYLGSERAERSFERFAISRNIELEGNEPADIHALRYTEHLLASAIGAASSRLVISLMLKERNISHQAALKLLDDASEALQYNRDFLQSALDQVGQGLCVFDRELKLVCWNRQFRRMMDLPEHLGAIGVPLDAMVRFCAVRGDFGEGDLEELIANRLERFSGKVPSFIERFDNGNMVLEFKAGTMPQGGVALVIANITERVKANEALAEINATLERRVAERTSELEEVNEALDAARIRADEANKYKTSFLAAASHDILQPLSAARIYTSCLTEGGQTEGDGKLVPKIESSLQSVEDILNALLELSRFDTGRMKPEVTSFRLQTVFDKLTLEFEPLAVQKNLTFKMVSTSAIVRSDERLLRRILQNLLSNAIKYTDQGGVLIGVRGRGGEIEIEVWDTGGGIPDDKKEIVFKEFERLHLEEEAVEGVGLGLSIVKRIAELLEHKVRFQSRMNKGTGFSVRVPRSEAVTPVKKPESQMSAAMGTSSTVVNLEGLRVLCIDDEARILESMHQMLSGWGCEVMLAQSVQEVADLVASAEEPPQLIIADYHLGDGTGIEAVQLVYDTLESEIPTVIVTGDHSTETQRDIKWRGLTMLRKPVKPAALRAVITSVSHQKAAAE